MLECVEEVNESKRFKAYFKDGTITKSSLHLKTSYSL